MKRIDLTFSGHIRAILVLGLPLVGGHLAQFAIGLTDTIMIGRMGQMPAFGEKLGEQRVRLLAAYVMRLSGGGDGSAN